MAKDKDIINCIKEIQKGIKIIEKNEKIKPAKLEKQLNKEALSIISRWYASYDPFKYNRTMSLRHAFKISKDGIDIKIDYNSSYLSDFKHHQNNDIIFNNSFVNGYHGGSLGTDKNGFQVSSPSWRTPYGYYIHWRDVAIQSFSPQNEIENKSKKIIDNYNKEWRDILYTQVLSPIRESYNKIV